MIHPFSIDIREIFKHLIMLWPFSDCPLIHQYPSQDRITGPCAVVRVAIIVYTLFYSLFTLLSCLLLSPKALSTILVRLSTELCRHLSEFTRTMVRYSEKEFKVSDCDYKVLLCSCAKDSMELFTKRKESAWLGWSDPDDLWSLTASHYAVVLFLLSAYYLSFLVLAFTSLHGL